ncbi:hypothetical protein B6I21_09010 [candidate division KSB1 bacterium 4572_119]|nr:MAG: hypothetical protein B6I21_09010 [candidate division KSB1 bacterium 4572_119]
MRKNKLIHTLCGVLIFTFMVSGISLAQKSPKDKFKFPKLNEMKMPNVEQVTLKNGMKLFLVEDHVYPTINMRAMIRAGSVYEPADKIGLASIAGEVLRTGGTKNMTGDEIDEKLETMAASIESGIGTGSGFLTVSMLKENLDDVLKIFADILMNPVFNEEKIELAKVQARSGISRRNDNVRQITNREFNKLIYGADSPYARTMEYATVDAITREDIKTIYKKFVAPNNMIMAIWGDFQTSDLVGKLEKVLAGWNSRKLNIPSMPKVNYQYKYSVNYIDKPDVDQSNIMLGHIGGLKNNEDYAPLQVMNSILSWERMFKKIRTDEGLAYSVWGNYGTGYQVPGVFNAGAQTKSGSTVYAIELMIKEIKRLMNEEVTDEELEKAKDQFLNTYVFQFDSKSKIVNRMMTLFYYDYPSDFNDKFIKQVENVTKADVKRVAATAESLEKGKLVFKKAIAAMGDFDKIKQLKNFISKLSLTQVMGPNEFSMEGELTSQYPDKTFMKLNTPGGEVTMTINGNKGVMKSPMGAGPLPEPQRKAMMDNAKRDPLYIAKYLDDYQIQYIGKAKFADKEGIDLLFTGKDNTFHMYFDIETMLPMGTSYQETLPTGPATVEEITDDFREVDGIKVAFHSVGIANGNKQSEATVKEIKFNVSLDEKIFVIE